MSNIGAVITVTDNLFQMLNSSVLKPIIENKHIYTELMNKSFVIHKVFLDSWNSKASNNMNMIDKKKELRKISNNISVIRSVLLDADGRQHFTNVEIGWIEKVKDVVYDVDDIFDEFRTVAESKVRDLFSMRVWNMWQEVHNGRKMLDGLVADIGKFGLFKIVDKGVKIEDTWSYINVRDNPVIGRDKDVKDVVERLLDHDFGTRVRFFSIVGVGGLGKTTLAQLVFNDELVQRSFKLRLWVCVSDQGGKLFDVKVILSKIIESITGRRPVEGSTAEGMQREVVRVLGYSKYLLVLDDVWNEDYFEWCKLQNFLTVGARGSMVLVTTRSMKTAKIIGKSPENLYKLDGLSNEDSWVLFKWIAFGEHEEYPPEFVDIGKRIVEKCSCVPLAIKFVGSLLYGEDIHKWQSFETIGFAEINSDHNHVISILKRSYHNLKPSVKCCFSYCALFDKDVELEKEILKSLWIAQGYIVPLDEGQSIEDAAEEHFSVMLSRSFFKDVERDESGDVLSFKIHDLMHDVAQEVAGKEVRSLNYITSSLDPKGCHVIHSGEESRDISFKSNIRTCFVDLGSQLSSLDTLVLNLQRLRTLSLTWSNNSSNLPDSIGKLIHLRCLRLCMNNDLKTLPDSIGRLHNLETLTLRDCVNLQVLPKTFTKLLKLRHLDIRGCDSLACMPIGMDKLTSLCVLTDFVVGDEISTEKQTVSQLEDLKTLVNARGSIDIWIRRKFIAFVNKGGSVLERMKHLKAVGIHFEVENSVEVAEVLMEKLKPHSSLRELYLRNYNGLRFPDWARTKDYWGNCLPNLVKIELSDCGNIEHLPSLSELKNLKSLKVINLQKLNSMDEPGSFTFFPSLRILELHQMLVFEGWWRTGVRSEDGSNKSKFRQPSFPCLRRLRITECPNLTSIPPSPTLETLELMKSNELLRIEMIEDPSSYSDHHISVKLDNLDYLDSLPVERFSKLHISKVYKLSETKELFKRCSSLRSLTISQGDMLKNLFDGFMHLTTLESLKFKCCWELILRDDRDGMPWRSLKNLRSLKIIKMSKLEFLPEGLQYLVALQDLRIKDCSSFEALPEWISCLSSLQSLSICNCPALKSLPEDMANLLSLRQLEIEACSDLIDACQEVNGKDWHKIKHIPQKSIISSE